MYLICVIAMSSKRRHKLDNNVFQNDVSATVSKSA